MQINKTYQNMHEYVNIHVLSLGRTERSMVLVYESKYIAYLHYLT